MITKKLEKDNLRALLHAAKPNPIWSDPTARIVCRVGSFCNKAVYHKVEEPNYVSDPSSDTYFPHEMDNYVF